MREVIVAGVRPKTTLGKVASRDKEVPIALGIAGMHDGRRRGMPEETEWPSLRTACSRATGLSYRVHSEARNTYWVRARCATTAARAGSGPVSRHEEEEWCSRAPWPRRRRPRAIRLTQPGREAWTYRGGAVPRIPTGGIATLHARSMALDFGQVTSVKD